MVKRKRFFHKRQTVDSESTDIEEISETVQPPEENIQTKKEKKRTENTSTSSLKPTGIIKYVYLIVFFTLLAGIMAPIVNPIETGATIVCLWDLLEVYSSSNLQHLLKTERLLLS